MRPADAPVRTRAVHDANGVMDRIFGCEVDDRGTYGARLRRKEKRWPRKVLKLTTTIETPAMG